MVELSISVPASDTDIVALYSDKIFILKIYIGDVTNDIQDKYREDVLNRQSLVEQYIRHYYTNNTKHEDIHIDAGFDLYVPLSYSVDSKSLVKVNTHVKMAMYYNSIPCGFYLYPRSSTGTKTPLRLANSVGVIDSGYRGHCIAAFDNNSYNTYHINIGDRLVQICSGNLMYPIYPIIVDDLDELGSTLRGTSGFGSTGC